jgi:hypothetical protein
MGFNRSGVHHLAMPDLQSQFLKLCLMLPKIRSNIPDSAKRFHQRQMVEWSGTGFSILK